MSHGSSPATSRARRSRTRPARRSAPASSPRSATRRAAFMRREWDKIWTKVWLMGCREEQLPERRLLSRHRNRRGIDPARAPGRPQGARLPQRLPAPRQPPDGRARHAPRHSSATTTTGNMPTTAASHRIPDLDTFRQGEPVSRPDGTALRHLGQLRLVQPRTRRRAAVGIPRSDAGAPRSLPLSSAWS